MELNQWYNKGIHTEEYIRTLEEHKAGFLHIYENFNLPDDHAFFQAIKEKKLRTIILAEVWCGHCMLNIPVFLRLAEKADLPVRILRRDENLELMDQYLTNGKSRTIPIFIFIDEDGNQVTKWGPIADKTKQFVTPLKEKLPPKEAADYQEKFTELIQFTAKSFRENSDFWFGVYDSMKETLEKELS